MTIFLLCKPAAATHLHDQAYYIVDVLWGQPIKLIQVASNSELRENQWKNLLFFEIVPSHCSGPQKPQKLTT